MDNPLKEEDIAKFYEKRILARNEKIELLIKENRQDESILAAIKNKNLGEQALDSKADPYSAFLKLDNLLKQFEFIEELRPHVWTRQWMTGEIIKLVGPEKGEELTKNMSQRLNYWISQGLVFAIKYKGGSNKYTFYFTRRNWMKEEGTGRKKNYSLLPQYAPLPVELEKLSEDEKESVILKVNDQKKK